MGEGNLGSVSWDSLAFKAGLVPGMQLLAVNGEVYSADKLREAIKRAEKDTGPITLLVKDRDQSKSVALITTEDCVIRIWSGGRDAGAAGRHFETVE